MKIQINGFDIEVNTEESNMTVKVLDANGKELSNNTYTQSLSQEDEINNVDMPSAEDAATAQPSVEETPEGGAQTQPSAQGEEGAQAQPAAQSEGEENVGESFIPDFATFRKMRKEGKI